MIDGPRTPSSARSDPGLRVLPFAAGDEEALVALIADDEWPFHGSRRPDAARVRGWIAEGRFSGEEATSFWLLVGEERVGLLAVQELLDPTPIFDLRLRSAWRGRGLGRAALAWLAEWAFTSADKRRIEGHTRADNRAMRRTFRAAGWVKEAHHRRCWPDEQGGWHDAITYALLREDWLGGASTPVAWDDEP